ncbi:zinc ribbon domain-containing protein [Nocardioides alcanivorans]|uniref:zinc ribbon domain-containing protein n=1 Tax=Nocardioides alcanivorans TaxID=2897352 RepID=UPI001F2DF1FD|nr:zinc ribbon domain-containing protein [Nocardioides alcanivorans]
MTPCPHCGAATTPGAPFCGTCGRPLAPASTPDPNVTQVRPAVQPNQPGDAAAQAPYGQQPPQQPAQPQEPQQQWSQQPPQQPQQQWGQQPPQGQQQWGQQGQQQYGAPQQQWAQQPGGKSGFDFTKLLVGNWIGMGIVALSALGVAFVFALLFAFTTAEDLSVGSAIWTTLAQTAAAFGANTVIDLGDDASVSIGQYPLLATFVSLGVAGYLFRRTTAGYRDIKEGLLDAVRAGLILSVLVFVISLIVSIASPDIEGYLNLSGDSMDSFGVAVLDGETKVSIAGAIFLPFLLMVFVLGLLSLTRRDWMGEKLAKVHGFIAVPLSALGVLVAGLVVLGLVYLVFQIIGNDDARGFAEIMRALAALPAMGLFLVTLGVFGQMGSKSKTKGGGDSDSDTDWERLPDFTDDNGAIFWAAPVFALALAAGVLWYINMKTPDKTKLLRNFGIYLASLLVFFPLLVRLSNMHLKQEQEYNGDDYKTSITQGAEGFQAMLFFILFSAVIGLIIAFVSGALDFNEVKAKAQQFQGQQGQPGQQQWGQQPPQQGQWGQQPGQPGQQQYGAPQQPGQQQWGQQPPQQPGQQQWGQQPPQQPGDSGQWGQQPPPQQ